MNPARHTRRLDTRAPPQVHLVSFTLMPIELRISFVASVSFVWLVYLSYASHKAEA